MGKKRRFDVKKTLFSYFSLVERQLVCYTIVSNKTKNNVL